MSGGGDPQYIIRLRWAVEKHPTLTLPKRIPFLGRAFDVFGCGGEFVAEGGQSGHVPVIGVFGLMEVSDKMA